MEDLYWLYRSIQTELYRTGRLADHRKAIANWNATHHEQKKQAQRNWNKNNRDKANAYARKSRAKKRQEKLIFDSKIKVLEQDATGKLGYGKVCPSCFAHMTKNGRFWDCQKCHKFLDSHEMQNLR